MLYAEDAHCGIICNDGKPERPECPMIQEWASERWHIYLVKY